MLRVNRYTIAAAISAAILIGVMVAPLFGQGVYLPTTIPTDDEARQAVADYHAKHLTGKAINGRRPYTVEQPGGFRERHRHAQGRTPGRDASPRLGRLDPRRSSAPMRPVSVTYTGPPPNYFDATVRITTPNQRDAMGREFWGSGSGVYATVPGKGSYVFTNRHVVGRFPRVTVHFWNREAPESQEAAVVWVSQSHDLAAVKVQTSRKPVEFSTERDRRPQLVTCGHPGGHQVPTSFPVVVRSYEPDLIHFYPLPAQGRSGSPIFSPDGRVLGIVSSVLDNNANRQNDQADDGIAVASSALLGDFNPRQVGAARLPGGT